MKLGLQLYNFRDALVQDFKGTLRKISKLGFQGVEFAAWYGNMAPQELKAYLKELNLECAGTMFCEDELLDENNTAYTMGRTLNSPAVTLSVMVDFKKLEQDVIGKVSAIGKNAAKNGLVFSYHNHWDEFQLMYNGQPFMDNLLAATNPNEVLWEPDVCWITRGGYKPVDYLTKYAGRIKQVHLKDILVPDDPNTTAELGNGVVDIVGSLKAAQKINAEWVIYEQDFTNDPFESAAKSLNFIKKNL